MSVVSSSVSFGNGTAQKPPNCLFTSSSLNSCNILNYFIWDKSFTFISLFAISVAAVLRSPVLGNSTLTARLGPSTIFSFTGLCSNLFSNSATKAVSLSISLLSVLTTTLSGPGTTLVTSFSTIFSTGTSTLTSFSTTFSTIFNNLYRHFNFFDYLNFFYYFYWNFLCYFDGNFDDSFGLELQQCVRVLGLRLRE